MSLLGRAGLDLRSWAKSLAASWTVILVCVVGFAVALVLRTLGTSADSDLAGGMYHLVSQGMLITALYGIATVGDLIWAPLIFWLFVFRKDMNESTTALLLAVAIVTAMALTELLKTAFNLPRPFQVSSLGLSPRGEIPTNPGLPSGHTTNAFTVATVIWSRYPSWRFPFVALAIATGICMIILGLHFPSDVVAGAFLGIFSGTFAIGLGKVRNG
jgi:membrane-associated phospholipid phosphatase